jgi:hypothetical protein
MERPNKARDLPSRKWNRSYRPGTSGRSVGAPQIRLLTRRRQHGRRSQLDFLNEIKEGIGDKTADEGEMLEVTYEPRKEAGMSALLTQPQTATQLGGH